MLRVLAVDDESYVLRALSADLRGEAFDLQTCADPRAALALLQSVEFDIILCDQHMPGVSGLELLTGLRKRHPNTVRLMLGGRIGKQEMLESIQAAGVFAFIEKPWKLPDLKRVMSQAVEHRRDLLSISSPGLTRVDFGPNDTIVIDADFTMSDLKAPVFGEGS